MSATAVGLDETASDPLSSVEREALTKIRQHGSAVQALSDDIASRKAAASSISLAELRRLKEKANELEALLGIPADVLSGEALAPFWPGAELGQARALVAAVDAFEAAAEHAQGQICKDIAADELCDTLERLLQAWTKLRAAERQVRELDSLTMSRVDLSLGARAATVRPLCDALLDKAMEVHKALGSKVNDADPDSPAAPADQGAPLVNFVERVRAILAQPEVSESLQAMSLELPDHELFKEVAQVEVPKQKEPSTAAPATPEKGVTVDEAVPDPMLRTVPAAAWQAMASGTVAALVAEVRDGSRSAGGEEATQVAPAELVELWHALHVGDEATLQKFMDQGLCNAGLRDASGHSVLWHAIAFNHTGIAKNMLERFPPGTDKGVDADEVHSRKGDTLLHLMCQSKAFGEEMAHLFKRISVAMTPGLFQKVNHMGATFLQIAAHSLNFWVLTFVLRNYQVQAKALICMPSNAALKSLAQVMPQPTRPNFSAPEQFPQHFRVAEMLHPDETGVAPYADLAFDVGADDENLGRFLAHRIVIVAQSPVLFQMLEKLPLTDLPREKIRAAVVRVEPRISVEVWRSCLQFMYTGTLNCPYQDDVEKVIELLRACVHYKLPGPILDFAQYCLYNLLPSSPPQVALKAFSICAGSAAEDEELRPTREASTYILLRSAHRLFENMKVEEVVQIVERMSQTAEKAVFNPPAAATPKEVVESPVTGPPSPVSTWNGAAHYQVPTGRQVSEDMLSQSMFVPPMIQDNLSQSMRWRGAVPQDTLSQSMWIRGAPQVPVQEAPGAVGGMAYGYPGQGAMSPPAAQAYGRAPMTSGTYPSHAMMGSGMFPAVGNAAWSRYPQDLSMSAKF